MYSKRAISTARRVCQSRRQTSSAFSDLKMKHVNAIGPRKHATLDGRMIIAIALAAHRHPEPMSAQDLLVVMRTVLRAAVGARQTSFSPPARWLTAAVLSCCCVICRERSASRVTRLMMPTGCATTSRAAASVPASHPRQEAQKTRQIQQAPLSQARPHRECLRSHEGRVWGRDPL